MDKLEKFKWLIIIVLILMSATGAFFKRFDRKMTHQKLDQIIQKQDQIIAILYAPPVYEKKIIFYEAADPMKDADLKPKRIKP